MKTHFQCNSDCPKIWGNPKVQVGTESVETELHLHRNIYIYIYISIYIYIIYIYDKQGRQQRGGRGGDRMQNYIYDHVHTHKELI